MKKYLFILTVALSIVGCSKTENKTEVEAQTTPAPTLETASPAPAVAPVVVTKEPDINDEALAYAKEFMRTHLTKCKDAIIMNTQIQQGPRVDSRVFQLLEPAIAMAPNNVSDVDKLNGLEWSGRVHILAKAYRTAELFDNNSTGGDISWSEWKDPELTQPYPYVDQLGRIAKMTGDTDASAVIANIEHGLWVNLVKYNKQWKMNAGSKDWNGMPLSFNVVDKVDCNALPKEVMANSVSESPTQAPSTVVNQK